ncbi:Rho-related protein racE like protein [Argiope bruennichi]|uniref:Rho-related protein racE like protein n=2 Tax=Argiope bruennichi TaxID=94029 RepID=A0A8T0E3C3_ARGBR|nr:Rho-related protein racE like protein [Argiope bruennichi]
MGKRKGTEDVEAEVEDSKKGKLDPSSEKTMEERPHESASTSETLEVETSDPKELKYYQIIVTGPVGCGKSWLVLSYLKEKFPPSQVEFLSKQYHHILPSSNETVIIWDLDSRAEFAGYRRQSYQEADIALLCFDIKKGSMEQKEGLLGKLLQPWISELDEHCRNTPIILVGLKGDLRIKPNENVFSEAEIKTAMRRYPRIKYYREVSARTDRNGVEELFKEAISSIAAQKPKVMFTQSGFEIPGCRWLI